MSKIRIGDIVIEGGLVHIGGQPMVGSVPAPPPPRQVHHPPVHRRKLGAGALPGVGAASLGAVAAGLVVWSMGLGLLATLAALPLGAAALGGLVISLRRRALARRDEAETEDRAERLLMARVERLRPLLSEAAPDHTVEWLVQQSGMTEDVVVGTLHGMVQRDLVTEDLCMDTGQWYYFLDDEPHEVDRRLLPVAERKALKESPKR